MLQTTHDEELEFDAYSLKLNKFDVEFAFSLTLVTPLKRARAHTHTGHSIKCASIASENLLILHLAVDRWFLVSARARTHTA